MGFEMVIVTARMASEAERTRTWVETVFPDTFSEIYFTSAFESREASDPSGQDIPSANSVPEGKNERHRLAYKSIPKPKSQICKLIGAKMLVDDSIENAYEVHANAGIPVALYGDWNWNKKTLNVESAASPKSYEQRIADGEKEDTSDAVLPEGIFRTPKWSDALHLARTLLLKQA